MSTREKFFEGLFLAGGTKNKADYRYAGGDGDGQSSMAHYHRLYYEEEAPILYPFIDTDFPSDNHCVCGVEIHECCYLVNVVTERTIIVGNCCIKRFLPEEYQKKCRECHLPKKYLNKKTKFICPQCREDIKEKELEEYRQKMYELAILEKKQRIKDRAKWTFKVKGKDVPYEDIVNDSRNFKLVTWIYKNKDLPVIKNYLLEYLEFYLELDENFKVIGKKDV